MTVWVFGKMHKLRDDRDELVARLLELVAQMTEHAQYMDARNDALAEHLREIEKDWKNCIGSYGEPK